VRQAKFDTDTGNKYPINPFAGGTNGYGYIQFLLREIIITSGTAHTSPTYFTSDFRFIQARKIANQML
jgi:hypothetical protein